MAFRLQLMPQTVKMLSCCQAAVRERVLHELGAIFSGPMLGAESHGGAESFAACRLPSGFHVRYAVDHEHGLAHLLELRGPEEELPAGAL
ncbi:MAG: hypothetical protein JXB05_09565 [Myxococcaceae bacterium]|nr:hypothetical protein [Myxococcaceae bacterium]